MTDPSGAPHGYTSVRYANVNEWVLDRLMFNPNALRLYLYLAVKVAGRGKQGYKKDAQLAAAFKVSERTIERWRADLVEAGVITVERFHRKNGQWGQCVYLILPMPLDGPPPAYADLDEEPDDTTRHPVTGGGEALVTPTRHPVTGGEEEPTRHSVTGGRDQGEREATRHPVTGGHPSPSDGSINPVPNSFTHKNSGDSLRSSPSAPASPPPVGKQIALIPDEVLEGVIEGEEPNLPAVVGPNAGVLTKQWGEWCERGGVKLPERIIKRYAKAIKEAIGDGFTQDAIGAALQSMARDRLFDRPEALRNHLVRVQAGPALPPERLSRVQADRLRQAGETPTDSAAAVAAFLAIPDPRKVDNP